MRRAVPDPTPQPTMHDIARAADVELRQLVTEATSLEDVFLELTTGSAS